MRGGDAYRPDEPLSVVAKVSADVDLAESNKGIGGTLRMRRDAVVQLSLTKFGIEGARLVCTPDSIFVFDRITSAISAPLMPNCKRLSGSIVP